MMVFLCIILLIGGFVALIKGADWFVDGSAALAKKLMVPGIIIGLTVVAMGTSAPELAVSISAAASGSNEIAVSNVVGSNLFNLLVVIGFCALLSPVAVDKIILRRDLPVSIGTTILAFFLVGGAILFTGVLPATGMDVNVGRLGRAGGIILLIIFVAYLAYLIIDAKKHPVQEEENIKKQPLWKCLLLIAVGIALIVAGGQAVVYSARQIALAAGLSETLIGLTIVAVGTSLPELVTSVVAARKGETGLAMGNVVGSCIFNLLLILGLSSSIHPIAVNVATIWDMAILIAVSVVMLIASVGGRKFNRPKGVLMLAVYAGCIAFAIFRS